MTKEDPFAVAGKDVRAFVASVEDLGQPEISLATARRVLDRVLSLNKLSDFESFHPVKNLVERSLLRDNDTIAVLQSHSLKLSQLQDMIRSRDLSFLESDNSISTLVSRHNNADVPELD
eukprot:CAMPEP_0184520636 /NCGR_PEP_ID=MMETSP0198_2-20121128/7279_1 /TAXON_ID=1112570 /ORGANISM="Thraustochytrium sp., Strain LLF1b" /LENGTH=118 /DNA_ID=CAMNT_0026911259 /DNA_START=370 /DNA_END=723 /DNA_ORIENTATION=+